jgi:hypothetical protein
MEIKNAPKVFKSSISHHIKKNTLIPYDKLLRVVSKRAQFGKGLGATNLKHLSSPNFQSGNLLNTFTYKD